MSLTVDQIARLSGIERSACQGVLDALVDARFLTLKSDGKYARLTEEAGHVRMPPADLRDYLPPRVRRAGYTSSPTTMPNLGPQRRKSDDPRGALTGHRCKTCREDLRLVRRHVSPLRLGPPVTTEFYQCRACDSGYAHNPGTGAWKPWVADES